MSKCWPVGEKLTNVNKVESKNSSKVNFGFVGNDKHEDICKTNTKQNFIITIETYLNTKTTEEILPEGICVTKEYRLFLHFYSRDI